MSDWVSDVGVVVTGAETSARDELASLLSDAAGFTVESQPIYELLDGDSTVSASAIVVADDPPASDGIDLFGEIRDAELLCPVVLAGEDTERVEPALVAGVTDYVVCDEAWVEELTGRIRANVRRPVRDGTVQARRWEARLGSLAHDAKNPLNVVTGRLEFLDIEETHADAIVRSITRVESLVDEISLVASAGGVVGDTEPTALSTAAERVWDGMETGTATLRVSTTRTADVTDTCAEIVFGRLFENALLHGGEDVTVRVGDADGGFYVEDDGPGLPEGEYDRVFEQGYGTARDGEGYGLFVASSVARTYGWELTAGESECGGARFTVDLR